MSDDDLITAERKELSPLQIFFVKAVIIAGAVIAVLWCAGYFLQAAITAKAEQITILKGGPVFWEQMERKLYTFADTPEEAFQSLKEGLIHYHLQRPAKHAEEGPEIAKTLP